ncbi:MAG: helix-turn-helix domain-containing protein [Thermodesulfobacteriota bacterium]
MEGPGDYLKREREIREISLEDVSRETKVSLKALRALEANDFDALPAYPFVKGFIRSFSKCIGIDGDDAVLRYDAYLREKEADAGKGGRRKRGGREGERPPEDSSGLTIFLDEEKKAEERGREGTYRYFQVKVILPLAVLILLFVALFLFYPRSQPTPLNEGTIHPAPTAVGESPGQGKKGRPSQSLRLGGRGGSSAPSNGLTLRMRAQQQTWMRVEIDDDPPLEVSLREGETVSWKANKGFSLLIGNAGGVEGTFNGKPLGKLGEEGEVVRINLTPPAEEEGGR